MAVLAQVLGKDMADMISSCKVLVVGAGGIGCELLKNLVSTGFKDIETIDLDTIDVSNLNRQFLFRKEHVGKSKAEIASQVSAGFYKDVSVLGHLGNIKDNSRFGAEYFGKFDIVLNALDNTAARQHVNRVCLSLKKSFVESGTQGFVGQVLPILPNQKSSCWECVPKDDNKKTYAVCTIRSTPDKPVHCIEWGKLMLNVLFAGDLVDQDQNMLRDLNVERGSDGDSMKYIKQVFEHLFKTNIEEALAMEDKWKLRKKPVVLEYSDLIKSYNKADRITLDSYNKTLKLSVEDNFVLFIESMKKLIESGRNYIFDKDDKYVMCFVSSVANLRMHCYHIEWQSEFNNKGVAGNIVHAIATTNAITAAAMVVQALHILRREKLSKGDNDDNKSNNDETNLKALTNKNVWVKQVAPRYLSAQCLEPPRRECFVCQKATMHCIIKLDAFVLSQFAKKVCQKRLGFVKPQLIIESNNVEILDESDGDMSDAFFVEELRDSQEKLPKKLKDPAIKMRDECEVEVSDDNQDLKVKLIIHDLDLDEEEYPDFFVVANTFKQEDYKLAEKEAQAQASAPQEEAKEAKEAKAEEQNGESKEKEKKGKENEKEGNQIIGKKRKGMDEEENEKIDGEPPRKKSKVSSAAK